MNLKGWTALIQERFPPLSYGPMILVFCLANLTPNGILSKIYWLRILLVLILGFSYFLRLRLFDEIKDLDTDIAVNPRRPLARGAISVDEVKLGIFFLIALEGLLFGIFANGSWPFWLAPLGFSLLMYNEFFISKWIRPYLTRYAVSHTFVSVFMGLSLWAFAAHATRVYTFESMLFFLSNWALFNLFEFARKTFAPKEERKSVESYSKVFGLWGACFLSFSQLSIFILLVNRSWTSSWAIDFQSPIGRIYMALLSIYALCCLGFSVKKSVSSAKFFRAISGLLLLASYSMIIYYSLLGVKP